MGDMLVNRKYIMFYLNNSKSMYINVIENNDTYFGYQCIPRSVDPRRSGFDIGLPTNKYSVTSYKNIFEHYFLFYKEIDNIDVREFKFLSHLSSRNINNNGLKPHVLSSLDLSSYISTFLE